MNNKSFNKHRNAILGKNLKKAIPTVTLASLLMVTAQASADIPVGYYHCAIAATPQALHSSLHETIDDHQRSSMITNGSPIRQQARIPGFFLKL